MMITSTRPVGIPISQNSMNSRRISKNPLNRGSQKNDNIPPSVAALLAVTSFVPPPSFRKRSSRERRTSSESRSAITSPLTSPPLSASPGSLDLDTIFSEKPSLLSRSTSNLALSALLSPPEDLDEDLLTVGSPQCKALSIRSTSSDSVPSLTGDDECSGMFSWTGPTTPIGSRKSHIRRHKTFSPQEDSELDHPLLHTNEVEEVHYDDTKNDNGSFQSESKKENTRSSKLSFKSNLTASLRVLKSAARSFSNLSAPMIQPEDFLTRSILSLSPQYNTDERRPTYFDNPTPALRRYLNPCGVDLPEKCIASIQLQTYKSTLKASDMDDPFAELSTDPAPRPREVRENSDFLRIIVLEMNMRRGGKLSDNSQGKARFILPPRKASKQRPIGDAAHWVALVYEET